MPDLNQVSATARSMPSGDIPYAGDSWGSANWEGFSLSENLSAEFTVELGEARAQAFATFGTSRQAFANDFSRNWGSSSSTRILPVTFHRQKVEFRVIFPQKCAGEYTVEYHYYEWPVGGTKPAQPNKTEIEVVMFEPGQPFQVPVDGGVKKIEPELGMNVEIESAVLVGDCASAQAGLGKHYFGSVHSQFALGRSLGGRSAGSLTLSSPVVGPELYSPAALVFGASPTSGTTSVLENGVLRQVLALECLADVVVIDSESYEIRFFTPDQVGAADPVTGIHAVTGSPFVTHRVRNPDAGIATNRLEVIKIQGAQEDSVIYSTGANESGDFISGGGARRESIAVSVSGTDRTETRTIKNANDQIVSVTREVTRQFPWGRHPISQVVDPTGVNLITTLTYYENATTDGVNYGMLKQRLEPSGRWERYTYDATGRVIETVTQYLDATTGSAAASNRVTTTTYASVSDQDGDAIDEALITTTRSLLGQEIGRSHELDFSKRETIGGHTVKTRWTMECTVPAAAWDASTNLVTKMQVIDGGTFGDRVVNRRNSDDTLMLATYVEGTDTLTSTTYSGAPNATFDAVVAGRKTVEVTTKSGKLVSRDESDIASSLLLDLAIVTTTDLLGRPTRIDHSDGSFETRSYTCCDLASEVDRAGIATSYSYDELGRIYTRTRGGITLKYTYDAVGHLLTVTRIGSDSSEMLQESHGYDVAGRQIWSKDALNRQTTFSEIYDGSGHLVRTATALGGGTTIETFVKDGSLLSVAGTAAAPRKFAYGVDTSGVFTKEIRVGSSGEETEWTKSSRDFAGRSYLVTEADGATTRTFYNALGQAVKQVDADGVVTLFAYDAEGRQEYVALDLDQDDTIDFSGTDRITRTTSDVASAHSTIVERTTTTVWTTDNSSVTETVSLIETTPNGAETWRTHAGLTVHSVVALPGTGVRTETTTAPDDTVSTREFVNDRLVSVVVTRAGLGDLSSLSYGYDPHGRLLDVTDARTGTTSYTYFGDDQVHTVTTPDPDATRSDPGYQPQTTSYAYNSAGRLWQTTLPDSGIVTNEYHPTGRLKKTYGARTYPQEYTYDSQGRLKTLKTWQDFGGNSGTATTTWNYHPQRGWLLNKRYADNQGPGYTYKPSGRLDTRTWARGITTTYAYNAGGNLASIDYSDATQDVSFAYDRQGRSLTTTDAAGVLTHTYDGYGAMEDEIYSGTGVLSGLTVDRHRDALGRIDALSVAGALSVGYGYDAASRLLTVTSGTNEATYGYLANSSLFESVTQKSGSTTRLTTTRVSDGLDRLKSIIAAYDSTPEVLSHTYEYNAANQRVRATREDGAYWQYGYDALGQVASAVKRFPSAVAIAGLDHGYTFDDIGNRKTTVINGRTATYSPDNLNRYTQRTVPGFVDVFGEAHASAHVVVNEVVAARQDEAFYRAVPVPNTAAAASPALEIVGVRNVAGSGGEDAVTTENRQVFLPKTPEAFSYDADGNLTADGRWTNTWDAENRLIAMETPAALVTPSGPLPVSERKRLEFVYDAGGRRVAKKVSSWSGSAWTLATHTLFAYDGWNMVAELNALGGNAPIHSFVWGLDLSGSEQGAGGVGGLLAVNVHTPTTATYFAAYDGNGNVVGAVDSATGTLAAEFEYNAFGETVVATGAARNAVAFRFSTKLQDTETGVYYYGLRYYSPSTGRWLSRDPIDEQGGANLYAFVRNDGVNRFDSLGLRPEKSASNVPGFWRWWFGKFGNEEFVRIPWSQFDQSGSGKRGLASEWFTQNLAALRALCAEAPEGKSWRDFQGAGISLELGSEIAWISGWIGAAQSHEGAGITIDKKCDRCEMEYGLDLAARDRSDFNPGEHFGPFDLIPDNFFIWIRDYTPFGRDYWIYADSYIVEKRTVSAGSP